MDKQSQDKQAQSQPALPQLSRVVLLKIDGNHVPSKSADGLTSTLEKTIKVELLEPLADRTEPRILVTLSLNGTWRDKETNSVVISLSGEYEGRFICRGSPSMVDVDAWLEDEFFRNSLISQAYIPANLHFRSQLEMMGVRTSLRPIGYLADGSFRKISPKPEAPRRRVKRKSEAT